MIQSNPACCRGTTKIEFTMRQCVELVTSNQYAILEHLAATAVRQKAVARLTRTGFLGGWTYLRPTQRIKLASIRALINLGLVQPCCSSHNGNDTIRISRKGVELLEEVRGEPVLA